MKWKLPTLTTDQKHRLLIGLVAGLGIISIGQLLYPRDHLPPFATIDSVALGGWSEKDASSELDSRFANQSIPITLKSTGQIYENVKPSDIGLTVSNESRVKEGDYPLWARLIPTSLLWYHFLQQDSKPEYKRDTAVLTKFARKAVSDCKTKAKGATITFSDDKLKLVAAKVGGICDSEKLIDSLSKVEPTLSGAAPVAVDAAVTHASVTDDTARALLEKLKKQTANGATIVVDKQTKTIDRSELQSWLTFSSKDDALSVGIDTEKSDSYFAKNITPLIAIAPGVTTITTRDFTETSRKTGKTGRTLDTSATRQSLLDVVNGKKTEATAVTKSVEPKVVYSRSYSKESAGILAMLTNYDKANAGVFGVSFIELGGRGLSAGYNEDRVFTTASTYKLFVAFSTLKYIDSGKFKWTDSNIANGRNLSTCFDDMIVKSDNACAEALIAKITRTKLDQDLRSIGLTRSTFRAENNQTTAAELAMYLTKLQNGDLPIKAASRDRLLSAMKRQVYRQGIPSGTSSTVADKVGFLNALLHDAAIVYSPKGTYVLVVLSDGSTWGNIADITRKIEALR